MEVTKGKSIRGRKKLAFCWRFFAFTFLSDGGSFFAISNLFSRFEDQLKAHVWRRRQKRLNDRNRKGEKRLLQRTQVFLPRIDLPFMTFILLFALKTHTALFRRAKSVSLTQLALWYCSSASKDGKGGLFDAKHIARGRGESEQKQASMFCAFRKGKKQRATATK